MISAYPREHELVDLLSDLDATANIASKVCWCNPDDCPVTT
jgi:hypothetical protein